MDSSDDDETRDEPRYDKPLHGPRKGGVGPAILVLSVLAVVIVVFAVLTWTRYNT